MQRTLKMYCVRKYSNKLQINGKPQDIYYLYLEASFSPQIQSTLKKIFFESSQVFMPYLLFFVKIFDLGTTVNN